MTRQTFILAHDTARHRAIEAVRNAPEGFVVRVSPATRSLEQNALLWSRLNDVSRQVEWHGRYLNAEDWKHVFTSALRRLDVVPNLDGTGFVALGLSTSRMTKRELSDLVELIQAFGAERGVHWTLDDVPEEV